MTAETLWKKAREAGQSVETDGCEVVTGRWPDGTAFEYRRPLNGAGRKALWARRADDLEKHLASLPEAFTRQPDIRSAARKDDTVRETYEREIQDARAEASIEVQPVAPKAKPKKSKLDPLTKWLRAAASLDETRYSMMTPWHAPNGDHFATDGHRLHVRRNAGPTFRGKKARPLDTYVPQEEGCDCGTVVRGRGSYYGGSNSYTQYDKDCKVCAGNGKFLQPKDNRTPVQYEQVMPQSYDFELTVNAEDLTAAVLPLIKFGREAGLRNIAVTCSVTGHVLKLYAMHPDRGDATQEVACFGQPGVKFALASEYFRDALIGAEGLVTIRWSRSTDFNGNPLDSTLDPVQFVFSDHIAVVMPIRR